MQSTSEAYAAGHAVGFLIGIFIVAAIVMAIMLVPAVFYVLSLQKTLNRCSPESRAMQPGLVWLMFIPFFSLVWHFFIVINIAKSLEAEFRKRGIAAEPDPGKSLGLAMCILLCCCLIPYLNILCIFGAFVCWIIYWVKIAGYSGQLAASATPPLR